eukprot:253456-Rhodomonas_salina.2
MQSVQPGLTISLSLVRSPTEVCGLHIVLGSRAGLLEAPNDKRPVWDTEESERLCIPCSIKTVPDCRGTCRALQHTREAGCLAAV